LRRSAILIYKKDTAEYNISQTRNAFLSQIMKFFEEPCKGFWEEGRIEGTKNLSPYLDGRCKSRIFLM
jgi:hypothetical protein